jgi:alanyl aminopeptidase
MAVGSMLFTYIAQGWCIKSRWNLLTSRAVTRLALFAALFVCASVAGCSPPVEPPPPPQPTAVAKGAGDAGTVPLGRLPDDVRPTRYRLEMTIIPERERFSGRVEIDVELDKPRQVVWLHGNHLVSKTATITPKGGAELTARYQQVDDGGVVKLTLPKLLPAGPATIRISFEGPFSKTLNGLYRVKSGGEHYAFTQMEPVWTRQAFPCFDEPAFKTPYEVTLIGKKEHRLIANTLELSRSDAGSEMVKVRFATTQPLPSYLLAFAVGPLDVVEAPPIKPNGIRTKALPFRGIAAKGRGKELAYMLKHTPGILEELEKYFDVGYPYDKLDILAVPDKTGAMENAGAITFREWLVMLDEKSPITQKRAFAYVMAHELAHQWFGNLVTMPWWDDIWLNEAFATWMGYRAVHSWRPENQADIVQLRGVQRAMSVDSLLSARQIRQPVENNNDIHEAFDVITYRKGGGVLGMFERWMGPEQFQRGLRAYMKTHRHGSATAEDLMAALSKAAGKDVATPFRSFLFQPGLPSVDAKLVCDGKGARLDLTQERYLPHGSKGDSNKSWQVPVCVRYQSDKKAQEACSLLTGKTGSMALAGKGCPEWVMPNARGAGYYQWSLPPDQLRKLTKAGSSHLDVREKMSLASAVRYAFKRGSVDSSAAFSSLLPLANDPHPMVASAAMGMFHEAAEWLEGDPLEKKMRRQAAKTYAPVLRRLGWKPKPNESPEQSLLRRNVIGFLSVQARDASVRRKANRRARKYLGLGGDGKLHRDAIDANLVSVVMRVLGEDADATTFDALLARLVTTEDEELRRNLLGALGNVRDPKLAERARALLFDDRLKVSELMAPLWRQMGNRETRDATWTWFKSQLDAIVKRLPPRRAGWLPAIAMNFCSQAHADETQKLFGARVGSLPGGKRELAKSTEAVRLCAARKDKQLPSMRSFFENGR